MAKSKVGGQWRKRPSTILWMLSLGQLVSWGLVYYTFPLFVVPMTEELGWSRSSMFGALSAGLLVADSRIRDGVGGAVIAEPLPPPEPRGALTRKSRFT